jgi:hypothetical protein
MLERTFGLYAMVLVDIDLSQTLRHKLLVERKGYSFYVDIEYENVPPYWTYCKMIGHHVDYCKKWHVEEEVVPGNENIPKKKHVREQRNFFMQTKDGRQEQGKTKEYDAAEKEIVNIEDDLPGQI